MRPTRPKSPPPVQNDLPLPVVLLSSLIAGAMFVFALSPYHLWGVALLSPLILYAILLTKLTPKRAFWVGLSYGTGLWAVGAFWLYTSIHTYGNIASWLAISMIGLMAVIMGLFHGVMAWAFVKFLGRQPFAFASIWIVQEWLKTWVLTGFPWLFVGYAYTDLPIMSSFAPLGGVFLVGFVSLFVSASMVDILRGRIAHMAVSACLIGIGAVLSIINPTYTTPTGQKLTVSLVQGNIPQDLKWLTEYQQKTLDIYARLSRDEWGRDLLVWPEGAVPLFQDDAWEFLQAVAQVAKSSNTAFITGIPYKDSQAPTKNGLPPFYNSALALGASEGVYKKQRLVPFGEYTPMRGMLDILPNLANSGLDHSAGGKNQPLIAVKNNPMGMAICYEVAYPETTRQNAKNSQFLLTISNDAWFGTSTGPHQHLQMVRMRSLETGRWFVRATNNGVTAIIDHKGKIVQSIPQFERGVLRGQVSMMTGNTPFMQLGHYPILGFAFIIIIASVIAKRQADKLSKDYRFYDVVR